MMIVIVVFLSSERLFPSPQSADRSTCSIKSKEDLWSVHPVHSPHYPSSLPPLGRLLTMTALPSEGNLFFLSSSPSPKHP